MKKFFVFTVIFFIFSSTIYSDERSEKEIKLGIFLEDLNEIKDFKNINFSPEGMFPENQVGFHKKQIISKKELIDFLYLLTIFM